MKIASMVSSALMAAALLSAAGARALDATPTATATAAGARAGESENAAATVATTDTPYTPIVARNMFGLLPIPPPHNPADDVPPPDPPPKITPNGIMTLFGKDQALFKVTPKPKPGQPQKDDAYVLAEGEMQDDITVVKINHEEGIITFNNHGTIQELPLVVATDAGPTGGPGPGGRPNSINQPAGAGGRTFPGRLPGGGFGPAPGSRASIGNTSTSSGVGGGLGGALGSALSQGGGTAGDLPNGVTMQGGTPVNANRVYQPVDNSGMTPAQEAILIEAQRAAFLQKGNKSMANILPPTPLTQQLNPPGEDEQPPQ
jgi:hypothetical protein